MLSNEEIVSTSRLEKLKQMTEVVADTGDIADIRQYQPVDATTNPTLLFKAAQMPEYRQFVSTAIKWGKECSDDPDHAISLAADKLAVLIGCEILSVIPGRVSMEVDARLSFDMQATIDKAFQLVDLYQSHGIGRDRLLIKIASTWEGIKAAEQLEKQGVNCNLTLLFNFPQAVACANANVFLISPFVGRIWDWYNANTDQKNTMGEDDPGVISVKKIYSYYKQHGFKTIVMGASFRNLSEIEALAGCDRLTINPALLKELEASSEPLSRKLFPLGSFETIEKVSMDEPQFRYQMNADKMASEKLAEGIRDFVKDQMNLTAFLQRQADQ